MDSVSNKGLIQGKLYKLTMDQEFYQLGPITNFTGIHGSRTWILRNSVLMFLNIAEKRSQACRGTMWRQISFLGPDSKTYWLSGTATSWPRIDLSKEEALTYLGTCGVFKSLLINSQ